MDSPSAPPRRNTETMMSRFDAKCVDIAIFGSQAGKNDAPESAAAAPRNWRRDSSLYSSQPQSPSWMSSVISIPLEGVRAQRETERLAHARIVERAGVDVRRETGPGRGR